MPAPLIAQLGKNYNHEHNNLVEGYELLNFATEKIAQIQEAIGGKIVFLECNDTPKLLDFYKDNGFVAFGNRKLDKDEKDLNCTYLVQMIKIVKNKYSLR